VESDLTRREFPALAPAVVATDALSSPSAKTDDICYLSLRDLVRLLSARQLSAREVMAAHLKQIGRWNPHLNAIVAKLDDDACLALADAADARAARGEPLGAPHGVPWAFKDLEPVTGFPWTRGSPVFRNDRPVCLPQRALPRLACEAHGGSRRPIALIW
jgi:amidase